MKSLKKQLPFLLTLLGLFAFRSSMADQYVIPSGSMEPTIQVGDHVLVDKRAYDFKIPFTDHRLWATGEPRRGDIVVFRDPRDPEINLIKRLVGLPGDHLRIVDGRVEVNGTALALSEPVPQIEDRLWHRGEAAFTYSEGGTAEMPRHAVQRIPRFAAAAARDYVVPSGEYFFMGDNRDNSADSRVWGFASRDALKGKALAVLYSVRWESAVPKFNFGRSGTAL